MNRQNEQFNDPGETTDAAQLRSLLEAVEDAAPPQSAPPFFASRVRALAASSEPSTSRTTFAVAARRLLPALGLIALLMAGTAGYESASLVTEREAAVARELARNGGSDALIGALFLAASDRRENGGAK